MFLSTQLSSDSADDRLWATAATSHILSGADSGTRRALQSKNIVGLLINLLDDPASVEVQAETCGALRNLAIEGGAEVCAEVSVSSWFIGFTVLLMLNVQA